MVKVSDKRDKGECLAELCLRMPSCESKAMTRPLGAKNQERKFFIDTGFISTMADGAQHP